MLFWYLNVVYKTCTVYRIYHSQCLVMVISIYSYIHENKIYKYCTYSISKPEGRNVLDMYYKLPVIILSMKPFTLCNIYLYVYMFVCNYVYAHMCMHLDVRIGMGMILYICMSIYMHMSTHIIKLRYVLIIYLISTFVHGFVLKLIHTYLHFRSS